jgi:arylsulfatase
MYMKSGRAHYVYNFGGLERYTASSKSALSPGRHTIRYEFTYDGGAPGAGGAGRLLVDGQAVGDVRVARTMPFIFSGDEGADVGMDNETPVTEDYGEAPANRFTGRIIKVTVETTPPKPG